MRLLLASTIALAACTAAPIGSSPTPGSPSPTPARATADPLTTPLALAPPDVPGYLQSRVTQSAPILVPNVAALPSGLRAEVTAQADSFSITYTDDRAVRIVLALVTANPAPMTDQGTQRHLSFRGDPSALAQVYDTRQAAGHRFVMWAEPATRVSPSGTAYDPRRQTLPYFLSSTGIDEASFWRVASSLIRAG